MSFAIAITIVLFGISIYIVANVYHQKQELTKKRYRECEVCGAPIELDKDKLIICRIPKTDNILEAVIKGNSCNAYEVFICNICGCQNTIKECFNIDKDGLSTTHVSFDENIDKDEEYHFEAWGANEIDDISNNEL